MSEEQPYSDEQGADLSLPDVSRAWQKMEALLDEEDRRRPVLPWWTWRTVALGLLLLGLAAGGWLWLRSTGMDTGQRRASVAEKEAQQGFKEVPVSSAREEARQSSNGRSGDASVNVNKTTAGKQNNPTPQIITTPDEYPVANLETSPHNRPALPEKDDQRQTANAVARLFKKQKAATHQQTEQPLPTNLPSLPLKKEGGKKRTQEETKKEELTIDLRTEAKGKDSLPQSIVVKKDSVAAVKDPAKFVSPPGVQAGEKKKKTKERPAFAFSAGIGFQQAIALHDQLSSLPDSGGRKRPFFDYFPSVYVKVQRGRWAAQAEAHYSVPQPVARLAFSQKTTYDAGTTTLNTERQTVQKLYYHQLPVSLNYHLLPQWSLGLGGVYNILAGAVTQKEVASRYAPTGAETVSKSTEPIKGYKDSFLYKTTAGLLVQTDYHWKRFSLGLRYTQNLQPFIKYTRPTGEVVDEKNNALQAVLRFRLWESSR